MKRLILIPLIRPSVSAQLSAQTQTEANAFVRSLEDALDNNTVHRNALAGIAARLHSATP